MFHDDKATIQWNNKNLDNRLPSIMTWLPSNGITKILTIDNLPYEKSTIHWSNKNMNNRLPSIMTRLQSLGVTKISKNNNFHNDKATIP